MLFCLSLKDKIRSILNIGTEKIMHISLYLSFCSVLFTLLYVKDAKLRLTVIYLFYSNFFFLSVGYDLSDFRGDVKDLTNICIAWPGVISELWLALKSVCNLRSSQKPPAVPVLYPKNTSRHSHIKNTFISY